MLKKAVLALIGAGLLATFSAAPAMAATGDDANVVRVCSGVSYSLLDSDGNQLSAGQEETLAAHMEALCDHTATPESKQSSSARVVSPNTYTGDGGYFTGYVFISPGLASWKTSASGLQYGPSKTLECTVSWNGGPYTDCGSATFTGSGDQTRTNSICPTPGQTIRVTAFLDYLGRTYYDDNAVGVTE